MTSEHVGEWPVLTRYDQAHLRRVALPIGGIGTGTVSLGGRGDLRDWEVVNRPAKGFTPPRGFFALRARAGDGPSVALALEGPIDPADYEGAQGSPVPNHGLPRFRQARFETAYPLGQVVLEDEAVPLDVRLQAFNPMVPADPDTSGIPVAVLRYVLTNPGTEPVTAHVCGSLPNFIGTDGTSGACAGGRNEVLSAPGLVGVACGSTGVDPRDERWGSMALSVLTSPGDEVTHRTAWADAQWGNSLLDFWDDFSRDGALKERVSTADDPTASLAVGRVVPAGGTTAVTFLLTWRFPNRVAWSAAPDGDPSAMGSQVVGNHYATVWRDAWQVATDVADRLPELEAPTVDFVRTVCESDLPPVVREAALYNVSTLRTQTCFRTPDGRFFGWEGCHDRVGSCMGNCTHVWNYESASPYLYGSLARSMREIDYAHATDERGLMSFRVMLPLRERARDWALAAADGQMGSLVKLYREWRLSGDDELLRSLWPAARRTMEFCWIPGGWDADQDGVMEGCQHNTMDVEYYGPNPQMGAWYLAALRACEEMARHLGEPEFAERCHGLFERGSAWIDAHLFNGSWYEHHIRPAANAESIAPGLRHESLGARDLARPVLQLGAGCLTDQLVGQSSARLFGLGGLLDPDHVAAALDGIVRHNTIDEAHHHFNHMRSYVLGDESALLMCSYPDGRREEQPFPYAAEVMTGCEYTAAIGLLQEGRTEQALAVVEAVRRRFDGWRRNPFDEAECGHHYVRAMASWGLILAWTGFDYEAKTSTVRFRSQDGARWFWSNGDAWGTSRQIHHRDGSAAEVEIEVRGGRLSLGRVELTGGPSCVVRDGPVVLEAGGRATATGRTGEPR